MAMLPLFLSQRFGLGLAEFGLPLVVVYVIADAGSIGGGWLSWHWIRRGWDITRARKAAMLLCCALTLPVIAVPHLTQLWPVIVLIGVAHAAHQGLTSNLFTAVSDLYPREAVGSVVGFGGTAGQIGAAVMTVLSGVALARTGSLTVMFLAAGSAYLVAFLIFHLLVPRLTQLELTEAPR
jgi:ACS family hexuronate transporter-like MFS transporter